MDRPSFELRPAHFHPVDFAAFQPVAAARYGGSLYSFEFAAHIAASRPAREALLLQAARHWRTLARECGALIRSYGGNAPTEAKRRDDALRSARAALAALKTYREA